MIKGLGEVIKMCAHHKGHAVAQCSYKFISVAGKNIISNMLDDGKKIWL